MGTFDGSVHVAAGVAPRFCKLRETFRALSLLTVLALVRGPGRVGRPEHLLGFEGVNAYRKGRNEEYQRSSHSVCIGNGFKNKKMKCEVMDRYNELHRHALYIVHS